MSEHARRWWFEYARLRKEARALTREQAIETLCQKVEEVLHNNDWPTEEGQQSESGEPSPIDELITLIRHKKEGPWT